MAQTPTTNYSTAPSDDDATAVLMRAADRARGRAPAITRDRGVVPFPVFRPYSRIPFKPRPIILADAGLLPFAPRPEPIDPAGWMPTAPPEVPRPRLRAVPTPPPAPLHPSPLTHRPVPLDETPDLTMAPRAPAPRFARKPYIRRQPLGEILLDRGQIAPAALTRALLHQRETGSPLGAVLVRCGFAAEADVAEALGVQHGMGPAGPLPDDEASGLALARLLPVDVALRHRAIPWARIGRRVLIATAEPGGVDALAPHLPAALGPCLFAVVSDRALDDRLTQVHGPALARAAECRVPSAMSCRRLRDRRGAAVLAVSVLGLCVASAFWPATALRLACVLGLAVMLCNIGLRCAALAALVRAQRRGGTFGSTRGGPVGGHLPTVSIMVPLHREPEIAAALTRRLSRLDYPRDLLDVCIVVEADDTVTLDALAQADLPPWMRVIAVPDGHPRTKPRAMNYALNLLRGDIVGIYDAEDAPAPDQLRRVAARFSAAPPEVACLQGLLDFYNPTRNWMSRCFTIEYANWFRLVLPGIAQLGLVVPLGGTTLFFRREALERAGGWDAHNVTEDADLGVRLARMGMRTEILQSTTLEEANASAIPWVKQRSRWMKGYVMTWAVHSARPLDLWRDLGAKRFWGFHLLIMGAVLNALLMPFVWTLAVMAFGVWHPIRDWVPEDSIWMVTVTIMALTLLNQGLAMAGCAAAHHRRLRLWVPTLEAYFALSSLAVVKALAELVLRPFHWDKTVHGSFGGEDSAAAIDALQGGVNDRRLRL